MFIQGSAAPIFVGGGGIDLRCTTCDHLLAQGFHPRALIAVSLRCFNCHEITKTAAWSSDEPLPLLLLSGGKDAEAAYLIGATVQLSDRAAIASQEEIDRIDLLTRVRPDLNVEFQLTPDGLTELEGWFGANLTGFKGAMGKARRARAVGNKEHRNCMLAWSLLHLQERLAAMRLSVGGEDGAAIACLQLSSHLIRRWQHHPLFTAISSGIVHEYPHAITQLVAATWLSDAGNRIGFTKIPDAGRSPDMFVNRGPDVQISIEVKAPPELQWPHRLPDAGGLAKTIHRQLKNARDQISADHGGFVVLGASSHDQFAMIAIRTAINELIRRRQLSTRLAGVLVIVGGQSIAARPGLNQQLVTSDVECDTQWIANPQYELEPFAQMG